ncbi:MAG: lipid IV(A) 3-deoxy-D-manno-octulosonic acid transferase [SAR86 cluster bacterium]|jgi:3-deoxy-D-manno-octulosonic-acid transferase|nr:lipid IV(A) 3-deoxy-D-manno-octulosonic acid transferase [SAR86 cluster bacterium]
MVLILYTFLSYLLLPFFFLRLIIRGLKDKDHWNRWHERLGISILNKPIREVLWVHAVSVGEVNAAMPLLRSLLANYPDKDVLVTTSTLTGSKILLSKIGDRVYHQYLPFDLPYFIDRFLCFWEPKALILLETELWPNIVNSCHKKNIFTFLVNARLSIESLNKYLYVKKLLSETLIKVTAIFTQYETDASRFKYLCPEHLSIEVCGNLKFDYDPPKEINIISESIRQDWSIEGKNRPTFIAASTHEGEEEIILDAFTEILRFDQDSLLILVPRHPERFDRVFKKIKKRNFIIARRSLDDDISQEVNVLLGDTMGELSLLYSVSDVAFIGGSLIDHGGQNLLEPASIGLAICSGKSLRNFEDISNQLKKVKALELVENQKNIKDFFISVTKDSELKESMEVAAKRVFLDNKGAVNSILRLLDKYLVQSK